MDQDKAVAVQDLQRFSQEVHVLATHMMSKLMLNEGRPPEVSLSQFRNSVGAFAKELGVKFESNGLTVTASKAGLTLDVLNHY